MTLTKEQQVHNAVARYVAAMSLDVLQLVSPGGQAPLSVTFMRNGRRQTVFPDLIALRGVDVVLGELKGRYSAADHRKIADLIEYGQNAVVDLIKRKRPSWSGGLIVPVLCHGDFCAPYFSDVEQWVFADEDGSRIR